MRADEDFASEGPNSTAEGVRTVASRREARRLPRYLNALSRGNMRKAVTLSKHVVGCRIE